MPLTFTYGVCLWGYLQLQKLRSTHHRFLRCILFVRSALHLFQLLGLLFRLGCLDCFVQSAVLCNESNGGSRHSEFPPRTGGLPVTHPFIGCPASVNWSSSLEAIFAAARKMTPTLTTPPEISPPACFALSNISLDTQAKRAGPPQQ